MQLEVKRKNKQDNKLIVPNDANIFVIKEGNIMNTERTSNAGSLNAPLQGTGIGNSTESVKWCVSGPRVQSLVTSSLPRLLIKKLPENEIESDQEDLIAKSNSEAGHLSVSMRVVTTLMAAERKRHAEALFDFEPKTKQMKIEELVPGNARERCKKSSVTDLEQEGAKKVINFSMNLGIREVISLMKTKTEREKRKGSGSQLVRRKKAMKESGIRKDEIMKKQKTRAKVLVGVTKTENEVKKDVVEAEKAVKKKSAKGEKVFKKVTAQAEKGIKKKPAIAEKVTKHMEAVKALRKEPTKAEKVRKNSTVNAEKPMKKMTKKVNIKPEKAFKKKPEKAERIVKKKVTEVVKKFKKPAKTRKGDIGEAKEAEADESKNPAKTSTALKKKSSKGEAGVKIKAIKTGKVSRKKASGSENVVKKKAAETEKEVKRKTSRGGSKTPTEIENVVKKISIEKEPAAKRNARKTAKVVEEKKTIESGKGAMTKEIKTQYVVKKKDTVDNISREKETELDTLVSREVTGNGKRVKRKATETEEVLNKKAKKTHIELKRRLQKSQSKIKETISAGVRQRRHRTREVRLIAVKEIEVESAAEVGTQSRRKQEELAKTEVNFIKERQSKMDVGKNCKAPVPAVEDAVTSGSSYLKGSSWQIDNSNEISLHMQEVNPVPVLSEFKGVTLESSLFKGQDISQNMGKLEMEQETLIPDSNVRKTRIHVEDSAIYGSLQNMWKDTLEMRVIGTVEKCRNTCTCKKFEESLIVENQVINFGSGVPKTKTGLSDSRIAAEYQEIESEMNQEPSTSLTDERVDTHIQKTESYCESGFPFLNETVEYAEEAHKPDCMLNMEWHSSESRHKICSIRSPSPLNTSVTSAGKTVLDTENLEACSINTKPVAVNVNNLDGLATNKSSSFTVLQQVSQRKNLFQSQKHSERRRVDDIAGKLWKMKAAEMGYSDLSRKTSEVTGILNENVGIASDFYTVVDRSMNDASVFNEHSYSSRRAKCCEEKVPVQNCIQSTQDVDFPVKSVGTSTDCAITQSVCPSTLPEGHLNAVVHSKKFTTTTEHYLTAVATPIQSVSSMLENNLNAVTTSHNVKTTIEEQASSLLTFQNLTAIPKMQFNAAEHTQSCSDVHLHTVTHSPTTDAKSEKLLNAVTCSKNVTALRGEQLNAVIYSQNVTSMTEKQLSAITHVQGIADVSEKWLNAGVHSQTVTAIPEKQLTVISHSQSSTVMQEKQLTALTCSSNVMPVPGKQLNAVEVAQSFATMSENQLNTVAQLQSVTTLSGEELYVIAHSQNVSGMPKKLFKTVAPSQIVATMPERHFSGIAEPTNLMLVPDENYSTEQQVWFTLVPHLDVSTNLGVYDVEQLQATTLTNQGDYCATVAQHPFLSQSFHRDHCDYLPSQKVPYTSEVACYNAAPTQNASLMPDICYTTAQVAKGQTCDIPSHLKDDFPLSEDDCYIFIPTDDKPQNGSFLPPEICCAVGKSQVQNSNLLLSQNPTYFPKDVCCTVSRTQTGNSNLLAVQRDELLPGEVCYFTESFKYKGEMSNVEKVSLLQSRNETFLPEEVCYVHSHDKDDLPVPEDDCYIFMPTHEPDVMESYAKAELLSDPYTDTTHFSAVEDGCSVGMTQNKLNLPEVDCFSAGKHEKDAPTVAPNFTEVQEVPCEDMLDMLNIGCCIDKHLESTETQSGWLTDDVGVQNKECFISEPSQKPDKIRRKLPYRTSKSPAAAKLDSTKDAVAQKLHRGYILGLRVNPPKVKPFQLSHKGVAGKTDEKPCEPSNDPKDVISKLLQSLVSSNNKTPKKQPLRQRGSDFADLSASKPSPPPLGELVWARLSFQKFWPAVIIDPKSCGQSTTKPGYCWVFWFGDYKVSEVPVVKVLPFASNFSKKYIKSQRKTYETYETGVLEAVKELASRVLDNDDGSVKKGKDLIAWASCGFPVSSEVHKESSLHLPQWILERLEKIRLDQIKTKDSDSEEIHRKNDSFAVTAASEFLKDGEEIKSITDVCIACGCVLMRLVQYEHPFFKGGLCPSCRENILESIFLFDSDGTNSYCVICGFGKEVFICEVLGCNKVYCTDCIRRLAGKSILEVVRKADGWSCFLCNTCDPQKHGLLEGKPEWRTNLASLFQPFGVDLFPARDVADRQPIRVLSLFDGIGTAKLVLDQLNIQIEKYYASEVDQDAITVAQIRHPGLMHHLGDVRNLKNHLIKELGPVDLLIGGSPCNELSIANPLRRGLEAGSGILFFDFFRTLVILQKLNNNRPLFWIYENVASMSDESRSVISRMFGCEPALWDAKHFSAQRRARYFWGNIPGMYCPLQYSASEAGGSLDDNLFPTRKAKVQKVRTITTQRNSLLMDRNKEESLPVTMGDADDSLWIPEVERIFGFPEHYTDVANLSASRRLKLLGQSWSVPVIRHLLSPLCNYFQTTSAAAETPSSVVANCAKARVTTTSLCEAAALLRTSSATTSGDSN